MPPPSHSRDLVLGLVHGYDAAKIHPFLDSLRKTAPHAEIILACSEITDSTRQELQTRGCILIPYRYHRWKVAGRTIWPGNTRWGWFHRRYASWINTLPLLSPSQKLQTRASVVRHFLDPNTRRFVEFYLHLQSHLLNYDRVLLTDLRDVVFQSDPFAQLTGEGIVYGLEDEAVTIGAHWANSLWVERVGGQSAKESLSAERVSCVGVVLGSGKVIARYLALLTEILTQPGINIANFHGADTGAHNLIVRQHTLPGVRFADYYNGGILNMHGLRGECIRWTSDDLLCDASGNVIPIVHQYDRHPQVSERLLGRLGIGAENTST